MTKIILIRHGQTAWNAEKRYCGSTDVELDDTGRKQAEKLSLSLFGYCRKSGFFRKGDTVDRIISSDRKRALQTAAIIFGNRTIREDPAWCEMDFGVFEGLTHEEIMKKYSRVYQRWLSDPCRMTPPKAEGMVEFAKRVRSAFKDVLTRFPHGTVAILTHGGPIRVLLCDLLNKNLKSIGSVASFPASLSLVESSEKGCRMFCVNKIFYEKK